MTLYDQNGQNHKRNLKWESCSKKWWSNPFLLMNSLGMTVRSSTAVSKADMYQQTNYNLQTIIVTMPQKIITVQCILFKSRATRLPARWRTARSLCNEGGALNCNLGTAHFKWVHLQEAPDCGAHWCGIPSSWQGLDGEVWSKPALKEKLGGWCWHCHWTGGLYRDELDNQQLDVSSNMCSAAMIEVPRERFLPIGLELETFQMLYC